MTIAELIEKVEKATEGSRELDAEISAFMCGGKMASDQDVFPGTYWDENRGHRISEKITDSIDAALSLVERKLPEWRPTMQRSRAGVHDCYLHFDDETGWLRQSHGQAWTLPLAIILALLRALNSMEQPS